MVATFWPAEVLYPIWGARTSQKWARSWFGFSELRDSFGNFPSHASVWRWRREAAGGRRNGVNEAVRRSDDANDRRKRTRLRFFKAQERAGAKQSERKGGGVCFAAWSTCWFRRKIHEPVAIFALEFNESEGGQ